MLNNALFLVLGAGLMAIGVLTAAFAERIRSSRQLETGRSETRGQERRAHPSIITIADTPEMPRSPTVTRATAKSQTASDSTEMPRSPTVTRASRASRAATPNLGDDVIAALVATGYKRPIAAQATWACDDAERMTIELWTAAALRRCGQGSLS